MPNERPPEPTFLVIFGAAGDLTRRKLIPALYHLFLDRWLPERFAVIGVDRAAMDLAAFRRHLREGVDQFSRRGKSEQEAWDRFALHLTAYLSDDLESKATYAALADRLASQAKEWGARANPLFYLAIPPTQVRTVGEQLGRAHLARECAGARIVLEKPFGRDLPSARALNRLLTDLFDESQLYRIDHYLGKETVQNILAFRFANALFEPIWDRRYIDHVQITVAEQVGVGHRGGYYDHAGALRDMVQNHLLQILCPVGMEPPLSFHADEIRNKKLDLLRAIRPLPQTDLARFAVRGQYGKGWIEGESAPAYRDEPGVAPDSSTETFAALKLWIDNWRWQDVPFYLRTGKRMPVKISEVLIQFRPVPHQTFPRSAVAAWRPNHLILGIQPTEGIFLHFQAKRPGPIMRLSPVEMRFTYQDAFKVLPPEAYETLLLDVMWGDATLFMRADQVEAAWSVITPVLQAWEGSPAPTFPNYPAGSWGPEAAEALIARDGRSWLQPTLEKISA